MEWKTTCRAESAIMERSAATMLQSCRLNVATVEGNSGDKLCSRMNYGLYNTINLFCFDNGSMLQQALVEYNS